MWSTRLGNIFLSREKAAEPILRPSAQSLFPLSGTAAEGMTLFELGQSKLAISLAEVAKMLLLPRSGQLLIANCYLLLLKRKWQ